MSAEPTLDALLARVRGAEVRPELAAAAIAEVERAARLRPAAAAWSWRSVLAGVGLAVAAAALILWIVGPRGGGSGPAVVRIGSRVTIVVEPGARYDVAAAGDDRTAIVVERGAVTARLWPGDQPHRLALRGADVVATATGTVYTLAVDDRGAIVRVHEGTVEVVTPGGAHAIAAGRWWPPDAAGGAIGTAAASRLRALAAPSPIVEVLPIAAVDAGADAPAAIVADAGVDVDVDAASASGAAIDRARARPPDAPDAVAAPDAGVVDAAAPSLVEQWRRARLLRAQGNPRSAVALCLAIADTGDPTWSPIALVEAIRIHLDSLSAPEDALVIADRMIARWPVHPLEGEAKALRCRALRQLGRGAECSDKPPSDAR
jgi:hypothetical protein